MEEKTYRTPGGVIHYWVDSAAGEGPWLVFLPGLTADHRLFEKQLEAFRGRYRCLAWDPPAHGASRPFALDFSLDDLAEWLHGILQAADIAAPVLVGQSMGGYLAQVYLVRYPGQASGFVSIDSCPLQRSYYQGWELFFLRHMYGIYRTIPWKWLQKWGGDGCAETAYGRTLMRRMMEDYAKEEYCALAAHGYRILAQAVQTGRDYTLRCPVLILCGEKDAAGSARNYNRRWMQQTGHPFLWVPGAGHNANCDAPDFVNRVLADFVEHLP